MEKENRREERTEAQKIVLSGRKNLTVTGVKEVIAFDETCILLDTTEGRLHIKGAGLKVKSLNEQEEVLTVEGKFDSAAYTGNSSRKKEKSVIRRLLQ